MPGRWFYHCSGIGDDYIPVSIDTVQAAYCNGKCIYNRRLFPAAWTCPSCPLSILWTFIHSRYPNICCVTLWTIASLQCLHQWWYKKPAKRGFSHSYLINSISDHTRKSTYTIGCSWISSAGRNTTKSIRNRPKTCTRERQNSACNSVRVVTSILLTTVTT